VRGDFITALVPEHGRAGLERGRAGLEHTAKWVECTVAPLRGLDEGSRLVELMLSDLRNEWAKSLVVWPVGERARSVVIVGLATTRPRLLNAICTQRLGLSGVPVTVGGAWVGTTTSERWPDLGSPLVVFEALLDESLLPVPLRGQEFLHTTSVRQGQTWPGPRPLAVELEEASALATVRDRALWRQLGLELTQPKD
jgi:hypothetical protein